MKKLSVITVCAFVLITAYASVAFSQQPGSPISAKVLETMNSGGYTYLQIERGGQKEWFAIPQTKITIGQQVSLQPGMDMENFTSKSLGRTFKKIQFSPGLAGSKPSPHGTMSKTTKVDPRLSTEKIVVEKASGSTGYTVSEIYNKSAELDTKKVSVRGKVVKANANIMGKNWFHIQDGTGESDKGSHDLTATSQQLPEVGNVVTVDGVLRKDKDFGSGYRYAAIIEDATITIHK